MAHIVVADAFPPGTPGDRCWLCGSALRTIDGRREKALDPNIIIHMEGPLAFCESCVREMGRKVGMIERAEADGLVSLATELEDRLEAAEARATAAEEAVLAASVVQAWTSSTDSSATAATPPVSHTVDKSGKGRAKKEPNA